MVRDIADNDNRQVILERFDNLNLNPASEDYIARGIGDRYIRYMIQHDQRNIEYGEFENQSNYIRVVMDETVAAGSGETRWLPFGVFGPLKYRDVSVVSGSSGFSSDLATPVAGARGGVLTMLDGDQL